MASYIVFGGMLMSIHVLWLRGLQQAFLKVWIPFFLLMPVDVRVQIAGLPDPNFMQAAILPMLVVLFKDRKSAMRIGRMEVLLAVYVSVRILMDFTSRGYWDAQNYAFYALASLIGPYFLGRYVISDQRMDIETGRTFVLIFLLMFPLFLYEARMGISPILKLLLGIFPNTNTLILPRWGIYRVYGTFGHPILAAVMVIAAYRLHRWLSWLGVWDRQQTGLLKLLQEISKLLPISFKYQISIVLIVMTLMTISRGPWLGALVGAGLVAVGNTKNRKLWLIVFCLAFLVGAIVSQFALDLYVTPRAGEVLSGEANTMLYRRELVDKYMEFAMLRLWTGWGVNSVPVVPGMVSVDNAFLLIALEHGVFALTTFVAILVYGIVSQVHFGLREHAGEAPIGFTFAGIYLMCAIAFGTVWMGSQTEPLIFLLLGWGESIKYRPKNNDLEPGSADNQKLPISPFRRVMY